MGATKTPRFYDSRIFEPVAKPQNQLFLSLETPGYLKKSGNIPGTYLGYIVSEILEFRNFKTLTFFEKTGTGK